jgi:hypothetical protein
MSERVRRIGSEGRVGIGIVLALAVAIAVGIVLAGSRDSPTVNASAHGPATVEPIAGTDLSRVTLSARAAERLAVATVPVRRAAAGGAGSTVIPYSAVLYDEHGKTFAYTSPEPLVFVRAPIAIQAIEGAEALLRSGPAPGTAVVSVGAAELFGAEFGVDH